MPFNTYAVRGLVEELDLIVPREGASVALKNNRSNGCQLRASRAGYLRLGIELMKAGLADAPANEASPVDAELGYLFDDETAALLRPLLQRADEQERDGQDAFQKKFRAIFVAVMSLLAVLAAIGMAGIAAWLSF